MSILKIIEYGNPILRAKSKEVTKISKKVPDINVIITGGDHKLLYNQLKNSTFVSLIDEEYLVLKGLNAILRYNVKE